MTDPGDEHHDSDILHRLDVVWDGMGEMALEERREAAREIRALRDEVRRLRSLLPKRIERILYEGSG
jgi:hypothetical protein